MTFARHLDGVGAILAAADRCAELVVAFSATPAFEKPSNRMARTVKAYAETYLSNVRLAHSAGVSDSDEARLLLKDGVGIVLAMRRCVWAAAKYPAELWKRSNKLLVELQPRYLHHQGFEIGDRIGMTVCGQSLTGNVVELAMQDNERGSVVMDGCSGQLDVDLVCLYHLPAYPERPALAA